MMKERLVEEDLANLIMGDQFRTLAKSFNYFCPFEALNVSSLEIRHRNFLAHLLDPIAPHGFGEIVLRSFVDALLQASGDHALRLQVDVEDLGQVEVLREYRNIDLVIRVPGLDHGLTLIVEVKVDAKEHRGQLEKYENVAANEWPNDQVRFFLLSPTGMDASREHWTPINFTEAFSGLEEISQDQNAGTSLARQMLSAYVAMLRRKYVPNDHMEKLAKRIWRTHANALEYLLSQRPSPMRDASEIVQLPERLNPVLEKINEQTGLTVRATSSSNTYLRLFVEEWGTVEGMKSSHHTESKHLLITEVEMYGDRVHIRMQLMPGDAEIRQHLFDTLTADPNVNVGRCKKLTGQFTRFASHTIKRVKNIEDYGEQEINELAKSILTGIERFLLENLPSYDRAIRP